MLRLLLFLTFLACTLSAEIDKSEIARTKSKLKQIGTTYAIYFTDGITVKIPTPEVIEVDESNKTYTHPETGKTNKFIFIQPGYNYTGASDMLLAIAGKPIAGKYLAVFEDGHVAFISKDDLKKNAGSFGLIKFQPKKINMDSTVKKGIDQLIEQLGASKFRERKAAKEALVKKGSDIISYLSSKKDHPDFEVAVSLKEIIKELTPKNILTKRHPVR